MRGKEAEDFVRVVYDKLAVANDFGAQFCSEALIKLALRAFELDRHIFYDLLG